MTRDPDTVKSKADFLLFLEGLRLNLEQNADDWESPTLERYLEALEACVRGSDNYYRNTGQNINAVNWRYFAEALHAASIYE